MKVRDTSRASLDKVEEDTDAYSKGMINELHYSLLKEKLSNYEKHKLYKQFSSEKIITKDNLAIKDLTIEEKVVGNISHLH